MLFCVWCRNVGGTAFVVDGRIQKYAVADNGQGVVLQLAGWARC